MSTATVPAAAAAAPQPQGGAQPVPRAHANNNSLYVGELSPEVTEHSLYDIFSAVGPVASIRVCRDAVTRRSLGYAYVNFQSPTDAERALDAYNYTPILGRPCRIMWCQRDPILRRSGVGNLFVNGLDKSIDHKELSDAFSIFGNILSCKILYDENGQSTGRGFVHFETAQAAEAAIAQCNGSLLRDKKITVAHFKSKKERMTDQALAGQQFKNVYIKNLPDEFSEDDLKATFAPFGTITSSTIMRGKDGDNGKSKGFGFVNFAEFTEAKAAVDALNGSDVGDKKVFVGRAMKKSERIFHNQQMVQKRRQENQERSKGVNLYIKNLTEEVDDNKLREIFGEFGTISSAVVMRDERNNSRGFGFVCFNDQADATRAVTEMNGRMLFNKPLYVALAQPKDERRQQLSVQHRSRVIASRGTGGVAPYMGPGMYPPQMMYAPNPYQSPRSFPQPPFPRYNQGMGGRFPVGGVPQQPFMQGGFAGRGPQPPRQSRPNYARTPQAGPAGAPTQQRPARQQQPNTRYNAAARNAAAPAETPAAPSQMQQLASLLASAEPDRQKQILGDNLYQIISGFYPQQAGKLTGMLLQMDNSDLLHLIEDSSALRAEVDKANEVLTQHQATAEA